MIPTEQAYVCAVEKECKLIRSKIERFSVTNLAVREVQVIHPEDISGSSDHLPIEVPIPHLEQSEEKSRQVFLLSARQMNSSLRAKAEELHVIGLPGLLANFKGLYISSSGKQSLFIFRISSQNVMPHEISF